MRRGRRFRNLLYGAIGVGVLGGIAFQAWLFSGRDQEAEAQEPIEAANASAPEPPLARERSVAEPPPVEVAVAQPPVRAPGRGREPRLPTQIAFAVQPQGEPDLSWFQDGRRPHLAHGCALRPGASMIPAALETTVQSEVVHRLLVGLVQRAGERRRDGAQERVLGDGVEDRPEGEPVRDLDARAARPRRTRPSRAWAARAGPVVRPACSPWQPARQGSRRSAFTFADRR